MTNYPVEILGQDEDDGTMVDSKTALEEAVVGRKIVSVERRQGGTGWYNPNPTVITLDDGTEVEMVGGGDCCAYTEVESFLLNPKLVDHMIMGVGTTDGYQTWHIYADMGDVLKLNVAWSCGNPFYYGYGFDIRVHNPQS